MKILGKIILGALAVGLVPYHIATDKETGSFEIGGVLWSVKKTPGEERDNYAIELLPIVGKKETSAE